MATILSWPLWVKDFAHLQKGRQAAVDQITFSLSTWEMLYEYQSKPLRHKNWEKMWGFQKTVFQSLYFNEARIIWLFAAF